MTMSVFVLSHAYNLLRMTMDETKG